MRLSRWRWQSCTRASARVFSDHFGARTPEEEKIVPVGPVTPETLLKKQIGDRRGVEESSVEESSVELEESTVALRRDHSP